MSEWNYEEKTAPKLTEEFKAKFMLNIKGKDAIKVDGLVALAHEKGIKSMKTKICQYPCKDNNFTCIASCEVVGYDYNPITKSIDEVTFEDFADASPDNCTTMTKASYPRMASTRAIGRALRKYTNIDIVTSEEIGETVSNAEPGIDENQLLTMKQLNKAKGLNGPQFMALLSRTTNKTNYTELTRSEADKLIKALEALADAPAQPQQAN